MTVNKTKGVIVRIRIEEGKKNGNVQKVRKNIQPEKGTAS